MGGVRVKQRKVVLFFVVLVILGAAGAVILSSQKQDEQEYLTCQVIYRNDAQVKANGAVLNAEVVDTPDAMQKGLSGRDCIGEDQAMLFVFDEAAQHAFWMKDMKFPIDIVWLDAGGKVVKVHSNVSPDTYPDTFTNEDPALYVLELQAGRAEALGLKDGSQIELIFGA